MSKTEKILRSFKTIDDLGYVLGADIWHAAGHIEFLQESATLTKNELNAQLIPAKQKLTDASAVAKSQLDVWRKNGTNIDDAAKLGEIVVEAKSSI